ncbi:hypothetical protein CPY51_09460 [Rhizobium tubonense]|uniref:Uncharacterized protein n=1 Tax=Rhizobium tubonense TaxID=484088 RepID=A0A2W4CXH0_9HYPH|nr:hypothetical protein CPY51_09460 [Rhizobium tubonense]
MEGQSTAALHVDAKDVQAASQMTPQLELLGGRILVNGFGTGAEVSPAIIPGGLLSGHLGWEIDLRRHPCGLPLPAAGLGLPADVLPAPLRNFQAARTASRKNDVVGAVHAPTK